MLEKGKEALFNQLERMKEGAQQCVDNGVRYYTMHAPCAVEFAENARAVLEELATERAFKDLFRAMDLTREERDEWFTRGIFNDIAIGYGKIALLRMGIPYRREEFESSMHKVLDLFTAKQARNMYEKNEF